MATADLGSDSDIEPSGDIELAGSASVDLEPYLIGKFSVSHGILIGCDYGYDVTSGVLQL